MISQAYATPLYVLARATPVIAAAQIGSSWILCMQVWISGSKVKMRSSKSRSRSKPNRPRTLGNIVNRVFDSSGPEGKVRGTPQQIIEKYQMLAGDAQRSNDRVAAENFSQHAEHYTRMLAEAMREMAAEQESRQAQQNQHANNGQNRQGEYRNDHRGDQRPDQRFDNRGDLADGDQPAPAAFEVVDSEESQLVDLPERARREDRAPRPDQQRRENRPRNDNRRDNAPRDAQPRDAQPRDQQPREDRPRENQPRENQPRDMTPRAAPSRENDPQPEAKPQLRFVDAPEAPVFESPAAVVAQVVAKAPPKPRAPRVKKVEPSVE